MTFSHAVFFCNDITSSTNVQNVPINEVANIVLISAIFKYLLFFMIFEFQVIVQYESKKFSYLERMIIRESARINLYLLYQLDFIMIFNGNIVS